MKSTRCFYEPFPGVSVKLFLFNHHIIVHNQPVINAESSIKLFLDEISIVKNFQEH